MSQPGFFDLGERYRGLDAKKEPLVVLNAVVPWEDFRAQLSAVWRKPDEERKNAAGRKPWDEIVIFKALVVQALYNLSDDQIAYQILPGDGRGGSRQPDARCSSRSPQHRLGRVG